jgi:hypothetical protein
MNKLDISYNAKIGPKMDKNKQKIRQFEFYKNQTKLVHPSSVMMSTELCVKCAETSGYV